MTERNQNRIGIVGDGQLGRMMAQPAIQMGYEVGVIGPNINSPAEQVGAQQIAVTDYVDPIATEVLVDWANVITTEIEQCNTDVLQRGIDEGKVEVYPNPNILNITNDKFLQKKALQNGNIPTTDILEIATSDNLREAVQVFGYPFLLKTRLGGFDGRGNALVQKWEDIEKVLTGPLGNQPLYAESFVRFEKELSIVLARAQNGTVALFPAAETTHRNNICHLVEAPARIDVHSKRVAEETALAVSEVFPSVGIMAIEMFWKSKTNRVLVNEVALRVHNSGHGTIEGNDTSQFMQHIRAIMNLPLGDPSMRYRNWAMVNILGERNGDAQVEGREYAFKDPNLAIHIYGKDKTKIDRKMGHITAWGDDPDDVRARALIARSLISI